MRGDYFHGNIESDRRDPGRYGVWLEKDTGEEHDFDVHPAADGHKGLTRCTEVEPEGAFSNLKRKEKNKKRKAEIKNDLSPATTYSSP